MNEIQVFRNYLAENGVEMTIAESDFVFSAIVTLVEYLADKVEEDYLFVDHLDNQTTNEKLEVIEELKERGVNIKLKDFPLIRDVLKSLFESA